MDDGSHAGIPLVADPSATGPLAEARDLVVRFRADGGRALTAVDHVNIQVDRGETLGLVGESGSGKSTLGRTMVRAIKPSEGQVHFDGTDITEVSERKLRPLRRRMQMIFQDPFSSLDARMKVEHIVTEPMRVHRAASRSDIRDRARQLLERVGLPADAADRYPTQFSGGQRQRIAIARALALWPDFLVADEPVSALDVSIQAQIISLLDEIRKEYGLTSLVIAHDLAFVHHITDRIAVMYLGEIVEEGETDAVTFAPEHPYTVSLLAASPLPDPSAERERERIILRGEPPSPINPPSGCRFHPRCPIARPHCAEDKPPLVERPDGRRVACHYAGELDPPLAVQREVG